MYLILQLQQHVFLFLCCFCAELLSVFLDVCDKTGLYYCVSYCNYKYYYYYYY